VHVLHTVERSKYSTSCHDGVVYRDGVGPSSKGRGRVDRGAVRPELPVLWLTSFSRIMGHLPPQSIPTRRANLCETDSVDEV